jgi:hypothetical protein
MLVHYCKVGAMYAIIDNIVLSYDFLEHYVSFFLQKGVVENVVKCFIMF